MYIQEVAKRLNTTARTIRFYEEKGLLSPSKQANQYRTFTDEEVVRISTILALREFGVGIKEIKQLLDDQKQYRIHDYLNLQRAVLFEKWLEMKDMIHTLDQLLEGNNDQSISTKDLIALSKHLRKLKHLRQSWQDKWDFDAQASDYDQSLRISGYRFNVHQDYETALEKVVDTMPLETGQTCLDIGIGTGNLGAKFLAKGVHIIGVDQSDNMLQACKQKHPEIEVRKGHFLALPILDQQVDGIVSSYALHHITDEQKLLALAEMDRVLRPNGAICIVDLMFQDDAHRGEVMQYLKESGNTEAIYAIEDEFYANGSTLLNWLQEHDYHVKTHIFNPILSMVYAFK
ncbi:MULTISPECIES: MerR family transcriptional regulator [Virgibacillus]|uniref:MerR family transcriptional regulator n=1 Tax=Virgibacillus TaxID=84406 RepID=UPI00098B7715|nr:MULTISPECIES: MerR family transcriptional regulator [Virgibacillus]NWO13798.1 methyltransferase domain-containing protein [Virgibacillus sp.]